VRAEVLRQSKENTVVGKALRGAGAVVSLALVTALAGVAHTNSASAAVGACDGQTFEQPFLRWLDPASYVLVGNGSLESTGGWTLSGGARLVSGNEPWKVHAPTDSHSLSLPSGSSATTPALCVTLLHPDLRFFLVNSGSVLATLKVEAITNVLGVRLTTPIGLLVAGASWQPTIPLPFLQNLLTAAQGTVQFRFTPVGSGSGWRIDDVYVDPFKTR
jgi:hypothetical protein